jgi:hypothetical protein
MRWLDLRRAWRAGTGTALLAAGLAACGGGGGNGGTGPNGDVGPIAGGYALVTIDGAAVPIIINFDHCDNIQFRAGAMTLGEDGTWQMALKMLDADGNELDDAQDHGRFARADDRLAFQSDVYGDQFKGAIEAQQVHLYYDWCGEGHADVDFTFSN